MSAPPRRDRRPWTLPVVVAAACVLLWLIFGRGTTSSDLPTSPSASSKAPPINPMGSLAFGPMGSASSDDPGAKLPPAPDDQHTPLAPPSPPKIELPPDTQLLTEEFKPGTTEWEEVPLVEKSNLTMRILPKRYNVVVPRPIVIYVEVLDTKVAKAVKLSNIVVRLRKFDKADDSWIEATPVDDGTGEDEKAGDGRYTLTYQPSPSEKERLYGHVLVEGVITTPEAGVRRIPASLVYSKGPRAHLTGKWRDSRRDGHLYIEGEVEVEEPGHFSLNGQLVGPEPGRIPIAVTRATFVELDQGMRWMTLRVWGKAIHDSGIDGPYQLVNVLLERDDPGSGDYEPGETVDLAHVTQPYRAADFMKDPWTEPTIAAKDLVGPNSPSQKDKPPALVPESDRDKAMAALQPKATSSPPTIDSANPDPSAK